MRRAMVRISSGPKPRDVVAGVPTRMPEETLAPFLSKGIWFLLTVIPISSSSSSLETRFVRGDLRIDLLQAVQPIGAHGSTFVQTYTFTNTGGVELSFPLVRHLDADLRRLSAEPRVLAPVRVTHRSRPDPRGSGRSG